ncbi:MAG: chloride channel protein [Bacteroidetes bacterium]|nr:MAG: chloride channel protein [Bacteroidota bacterium]
MNIKLLQRIGIIRVKKLAGKQFIYIISIVIGIIAGLVASLIKTGVHQLQALLRFAKDFQYQSYLHILYPLIGIGLAVIFIKFIIKRHVGHGVPSVLYAISKQYGIIPKHNTFSSIVSSILTVGFGGSVGLEGPTVATGAAFGSSLGQIFRLNYRQITQLLAIASAAALAAIFKAPIAAIVFAMEVIMIDLTMVALVPLLLASVTAVLTSYAFMGRGAIYAIQSIDPFSYSDLIWYALLGVFAGFVSIYFTKVYIKIAQLFSDIKSWYKRLLIGGSILGFLVFLFPALYGEGYEFINSALHGNYSLMFDNSLFVDFQDNIWVILGLMLVIILMKAIATSVTFGAGGIGGVFAPSLFLGTYSGLFFAKAINVSSLAQVSESNFALVGMAGIISGVLQAPLTAIFLIAEITTGYQLFVPLMITSALAYATTKIFVPNSVYTYQLARRGELMTHHKDKVVLQMMHVDKLIEKDFAAIGPDATLGDMVNLVSKAKRNIFPVIDDTNHFYGIVTLDVIRSIMFKPELYDEVKISEFMFQPLATVSPDESMEEVANKFNKTGNYTMPVIKNGKYLGFVSRANVYSAYRKLLKDFSED